MNKSEKIIALFVITVFLMGCKNHYEVGGIDMKLSFNSLEEAKKVVHDIKAQKGLPKGGIVISINDGNYFLSSSFELSEEDSGTKDSPVIYRGKSREGVKIRGGKRIAGWQKVTNPEILRRLPPDAAKYVLEADLIKNGITDCGTMKSRGFSRAISPAALELFCNGKPMVMARWPNRGFVHITDIVRDNAKDDSWGGAIGLPESGFYFKNERIKRWIFTDDIWVHGYWCWDWANSYERIVSIDKESGLIKTAEPYCVYGFRANQRFFFLNVLEELDQPGEWYLDKKEGKIYFWPPEPIVNCEVWGSVTAEPLVKLKNVSYVRIENMTFEYTRGNGIEIEGGNNIIVAGCTINNTGNNGIVINGGLEHTVLSCDITYTGDCGVYINCLLYTSPSPRDS